MQQNQAGIYQGNQLIFQSCCNQQQQHNAYQFHSITKINSSTTHMMNLSPHYMPIQPWNQLPFHLQASLCESTSQMSIENDSIGHAQSNMTQKIEFSPMEQSQPNTPGQSQDCISLEKSYDRSPVLPKLAFVFTLDFQGDNVDRQDLNTFQYDNPDSIQQPYQTHENEEQKVEAIQDIQEIERYSTIANVVLNNNNLHDYLERSGQENNESILMKNSEYAGERTTEVLSYNLEVVDKNSTNISIGENNNYIFFQYPEQSAIKSSTDLQNQFLSNTFDQPQQQQQQPLQQQQDQTNSSERIHIQHNQSINDDDSDHSQFEKTRRKKRKNNHEHPLSTLNQEECQNFTQQTNRDNYSIKTDKCEQNSSYTLLFQNQNQNTILFPQQNVINPIFVNNPSISLSKIQQPSFQIQSNINESTSDKINNLLLSKTLISKETTPSNNNLDITKEYLNNLIPSNSIGNTQLQSQQQKQQTSLIAGSTNYALSSDVTNNNNSNLFKNGQIQQTLSQPIETVNQNIFERLKEKTIFSNHIIQPNNILNYSHQPQIVVQNQIESSTDNNFSQSLFAKPLNYDQYEDNNSNFFVEPQTEKCLSEEKEEKQLQYHQTNTRDSYKSQNNSISSNQNNTKSYISSQDDIDDLLKLEEIDLNDFSDVYTPQKQEQQNQDHQS